MPQYRLQELKETDLFDPTTIDADAPFTQASFYGDWQKNLERAARKFLVLDGQDKIAYFQIIKYSLPFDKSYLYIPYGPVIKDNSEDLLIFLKENLKKIAKSEQAVFLRLDFMPRQSNKLLSRFFKKAPQYTYHSAYFQPRYEWLLNLETSEEELLKGMHDNTRYSIRLAERKEIKTEIVTENFKKYFEDFYRLMSCTAERNKFALHPKAYYECIFQNLNKAENSYLSVAKYKDKILVINLIIIFGKTAAYVFSCSNNEERNRAPSYQALWKAILHAKKLNMRYFNFGGISNGDPLYKSWEGLTSFKKKFGGKETRHSDFFDLVTNPFWYQLYILRKRIKNIFS